MASGQTADTDIPACMVRLHWTRWHWMVVFTLFAAHTALVFPDAYKPIYRAMGMHLVSYSFLQAVLAGIFGGWLVALMSWLVDSSKSPITKIVFIYLTTYLLVALQLYHCIIGSIEVLLAIPAGAPIDVTRWLTAFLLPAVIGNTLGGVILVTALKGYQARSGKTGAPPHP
jgi:formate/nitrite transporter FocA (FNT family)